MILQRLRIIVGDAGFKPWTSAPEVLCVTNEPPHITSTVKLWCSRPSNHTVPPLYFVLVCSGKLTLLKGQCHEIFELYFFSLIKPIWAKMVFLKNSFSRRYSNLKFEKFDSAQANTARNMYILFYLIFSFKARRGLHRQNCCQQNSAQC